jgi:hypothetical protein
MLLDLVEDPQRRSPHRPVVAEIRKVKARRSSRQLCDEQDQGSGI